MTEDFFIKDQETSRELLLIDKQWEEIISCGQSAYYSDVISIEVLRSDLEARTNHLLRDQNFFVGKISFCTFMPMRVIPFRIVCLLGMNDNKYPRVSIPIGFDLVHEQERKGDRSRYDDDKYLFLEAVTSAQDYLYISYIGQSTHDNTECYPSLLVTELLNYIDQCFYLSGSSYEDLGTNSQGILRYIQFFHSRIALSEAIPRNKNLSIGTYQVSLPPKEKVIRISQLINFWSHPVRAWFQQGLGVDFKIDTEVLPDKEVFSLEHYDRYRINKLLVDSLAKGENTERIYKKFFTAGALPYGAFGEKIWKDQWSEMKKIPTEAPTRLLDNYTSWEVNLNLAGIELAGWLTNVNQERLLRWRPNILNTNDGISLWLEHLLYCVLGGTGESIMFGRNKTYWQFRCIPHQDAISELTRYIKGFLEGLSNPLLLLSRSGSAWLDSCYSKTNQKLLTSDYVKEKAKSSLSRAWIGDYNIAGECSDPYLRRLDYSFDKDFVDQVIKAAQDWYLPIYEANSW